MGAACSRGGSWRGPRSAVRRGVGCWRCHTARPASRTAAPGPPPLPPLTLLPPPPQVTGILTGDISLIGRSLDSDVIVEPVRGPLIPGMLHVKAAAKAAGGWRRGLRVRVRALCLLHGRGPSAAP